MRKGNLIVFSGPSGCGKGTVLGHFFEKHPDYKLKFSVSVTTRQPREGEQDGVNYYFIDQTTFDNMVSNDGLLEWASFCGNSYGTPKEEVLKTLDTGCDVILEIEVQGALKVMEKMPDAVSVFIIPPSFEELEKRLVGRQTEDEETIKKRLNTAKSEIKNIEKYKYVLINDDAKECAERLYSILTAEHLKTNKNINYLKEVYDI